MHTKWVFKHFSVWQAKQVRTLSLLWALSILSGIVLCIFCQHNLTEALRSLSAISPLGLILVCSLPLAFTIVGLVLPLFPSICIAVILSGFAHGFCGILIYIALGSAAWILRPLLLFSASCTSVLMWWLILKRRVRYQELRLTGVVFCLFYFLDLFVVSPFVGDLIKYF